jgi:cephalosporin-C deacetylase
MQVYDLPLDALRSYRPELSAPADFDAYWAEALAELASVPARLDLEPLPYPARGVALWRGRFPAAADGLVEVLYAEPTHDKARRPLPGLALYHGYNSAPEGNVHDVVRWALSGYATLAMLARGQQGGGDGPPSPHGHALGWMTQGVLDERRYYYRHVYLDAVRAVELLASRPGVDPGRVGVPGASQGGGLALAAAALSPIPVAAAAAHPYLCHFRRAVKMAPAGPYLEIPEFLRRNGDPAAEDALWRTLALCDVMNLAPRVGASALLGIGLVDAVTPPSTVFAAFNHLGGEKAIRTYRHFGHETIPRFETERLAFLFERLQA